MTLRSLRTALAFLLVSGMISGCGQLRELPTVPVPLPDPIDPAATLTRVQNEVFTPTCATRGCHDAAVQQSSLSLVTGRSFGETVNKPSVEIPQLVRVSPGDPDRSYLYRKITGAQGITGDRMPQALTPLPDVQIRLIRDWIRRGAPND